MTTSNLAVIAQIIGFGVFLWVGLYLLVRTASRTPEIVVSLVGLFAQAVFFGAAALTDTATDVRWFIMLERWTWWSAVVPAAAWFHLSSLIARRAWSRHSQRDAPIFTPLVIVTYVAAGLLALLGGASDLFTDYARPERVGNAYALRTGPAYISFAVYLALVASGAFANMLRALRQIAYSPWRGDRVLAQQLRLLAGGALFFLAGGLWLSARHYWALAVSAVPGYLCLFVGLIALGYGVAHLGLLIKGQNIRRDFIYNFTGISLMNLLYAGLLALTGLLSVDALLALIGLVTLTHQPLTPGATSWMHSSSAGPSGRPAPRRAIMRQCWARRRYTHRRWRAPSRPSRWPLRLVSRCRRSRKTRRVSRSSRTWCGKG